MSDIREVIERLIGAVEHAENIGDWSAIRWREEDIRAVCGFAKAHLSDPPADLVETVAGAMMRFRGMHADDPAPDELGLPVGATMIDVLRPECETILTALRGRLVEPGHVSVPVEDLLKCEDGDFQQVLANYRRIRRSVIPPSKQGYWDDA